MAVIGIGIDTVEIHRIESSLNRFGDRFRNKLFSKREKEKCESRADHAACYAARFAAKEAFFKALPKNQGIHVGFLDVEVINHENGKPDLILCERLHNELTALGINNIQLSLTHSQILASAVVVMESVDESELNV